MNELTQRGINALKANDRASARKLLAAALQQDQNDATAWLWLAAAMETPGQRIDCLRQVLKIDPHNQAAIKGLSALGAPAGEAAPADAPPPVESATPPPALDTLAAAAADGADMVDAQPAQTEPSILAESLPAEESAAPQPAAQTAPHVQAARYRPRVHAEADDSNARKIFKTRPSNIPALMAFWVFFFGALFVGSQVSALNPGGTFQAEGPLEGMPFAFFGMLFALGLGLLLEIVVLYVVIRNMRTHYELSSASLTMPFRGRRTSIPVRDIYKVKCRQSFLQRLYGAGDVLVNAAVQGELANLRLRSVPGCDKRAQEISYLIQDKAA